jgi:ribose 5-phosphate isomerase B
MLYIASDHAGYQLKKHLVTFLNNTLKIPVKDLGPEKFDEDDDYPDFALTTAKKVTESKTNIGILICGSGNGICLAANKVNGVRAILGYNIEAAEFGRKHNDANMLCLAGRVLSDEHATAIVKKFLETEFTNDERHVRRLKKIPGAVI